MKIPLIDIKKRKTTFDEVEIGFTKKEALAEAKRCLQCADPLCVKGCPAHENIPKFIKLIKEDKLNEAAKVIREKNYFPSICGRICQQEKQCEGSCILERAGNPINIGGLERYVGDNAVHPKAKKTTGKKVAIIGSGPSGLTAAANRALNGISVTVFERTHALGGVIKYGVPEFRLPKEVVGKELRALHDLGIDFEPDAKINDASIAKLAKEFDAVFMGTGVGLARKLKVKGVELKGIIPAMKFLVNLNQSDMPMINDKDNVVVVGAGYVGIDASRSAIRLGAKKVTCVTVATREDAEAGVSKKDYREAEEEGVKFMFGLTVNKFESTGDESSTNKFDISNSEVSSSSYQLPNIFILLNSLLKIN